jgi:hypothetical protein
LRKATIHGWTGLIFVAKTSTFAALTSRKELDRTGIYILAGPDPDQVGGMRAYIGSANSVQERIKQSAVQRDFWETAIAVTTSDDDLSKGHVEYLEARLIELATQANRVALDNGNNPASQRRRLPEADEANMEQFLANLKIMLPVSGLDMLKPQELGLGVGRGEYEERQRHQEQAMQIVWTPRRPIGNQRCRAVIRRRRPLDEQWSFGRPSSATGYMQMSSVTVHRVECMPRLSLALLGQ